MIRVGVAGYGYWGPNLVRNFTAAPGSAVVAVCDQNPNRLPAVAARYPGVATTTDYDDLLRDTTIDAIAVATPVSSHYDLAMRCLKAGKHVLVEKPLTSSSEEASRLIDEAATRKLTLMVDHTFAYTSAVRKIKELIAGDSIGQLYYYDSVRVNLGLFQHDVSVLWDLAVHDLSILDYLVGLSPNAVSATGMTHVPGRPENVAYLTLYFDGGLIAHVHVNWLAPVKIRRTLIGGSLKMIVYDDLEPSEKVKVYDKGVTVNNNPDGIYQALIGYRTGDMWAPHLEVREALDLEVRHFVDCIEHSVQPATDGLSGLRVVRTLELASLSLERRGAPVEMGRSDGMSA